MRKLLYIFTALIILSATPAPASYSQQPPGGNGSPAASATPVPATPTAPLLLTQDQVRAWVAQQQVVEVYQARLAEAQANLNLLVSQMRDAVMEANPNARPGDYERTLTVLDNRGVVGFVPKKKEKP